MSEREKFDSFMERNSKKLEQFKRNDELELKRNEEIMKLRAEKGDPWAQFIIKTVNRLKDT